MNERFYEALEVCLKALETGADIEAVLRLYPNLMDELRPVLEASIHAQSIAAPNVPEAAMQRGRARVLQYAAEMRRTVPKPRRRWSMFAFPRLATSLALALVFLLSGTGLVSASTGALPGDRLYPVKRSWEGLRLLLVFSPEEREGLESDFEQERLDEISELLVEGRKETIAFAGLVTSRDNGTWKVSGITVVITSSSHLPVDPVPVGAPVIVIGHTNSDGFVQVDTLDLLGPGASLPPLEPSQFEVEGPEGHETESDPNGNQPPEGQESAKFEFQGVVESMDSNIWVINGQPVNVEFAESEGTISVGVLVEFEGYYSPDGQLIVTKIEAKSSGLFQSNQLSGSGKGTGSSNKSGGGGDDGGGSSNGSENNSNGDDHSEDSNGEDEHDN